MTDDKIRSSTTRTGRTSPTSSTDAADRATSPQPPVELEQCEPGRTLPDAGLESARASKRRLDRATGGSRDPGADGSDTERAADSGSSTTTVKDLRTGRTDADSTPLADTTAGQKLADAIADADSIDDLRFDGRGSTAKHLSFDDLRRLQQNPEKLRAFITSELKKRDDIDGEWTADPTTGFFDAKSEKITSARSEIVADVENKTMQTVKTRVADLAADQIEGARELTEGLNRNAETRRRFLASLASQLDSHEQVQRALTEQGLDRTDATAISASLAEIQNDPEKLDAFLDPERSPDRFELADKRLESHFDEKISDLESTATRIENDENNPWNTGREILADPNYKFAREAVFEDLGIDPDLADGAAGVDTDEDGVNSLVAEEVRTAERNAQLEGAANFAITAAASIGTAGLGGAAVGLGTAAVSNTPELARAFENVSVARGAHDADLTDADQVASARAERDAALLGAVLDVGLAGASATDTWDDLLGDANPHAQKLAKKLGGKAVRAGTEATDRTIRQRLNQ